jgi:opacity protein-like surface antigen
MKKISVVVLVIVGLMFAAYAEAAKPKRRSRNANRIGPYAGVLIGQDRYTGDQLESEQEILTAFGNVESQNVSVGTDDSDIGYQAAFGYRFARYFAVELGLAQYGELSSRGRGDVDLGEGFQPATIDFNFSIGGPVVSGIGIFPFNDKFEMFGRAGMLFASSEREVITRVNGENAGFGSAKGDSANLVLGLGLAWNLNQMYSLHAEVQKVDGVGDEPRTGEEDVTSATLGFIVRF